MLKVGAVLILAVLSCLGQQIGNPAHFASFGVGLQKGASSNPTGWTNICSKSTEVLYACQTTDIVSGVTSVRAGIETLVFTRSIFKIFLKTDAGVAVGVDGTSGGSFGAGVAGVTDISKFANVPNTYFVFSASWLKSNVLDATANWYGRKGAFRFGFGRTF